MAGYYLLISKISILNIIDKWQYELPEYEIYYKI